MMRWFSVFIGDLFGKEMCELYYSNDDLIKWFRFLFYCVFDIFDFDVFWEEFVGLNEDILEIFRDFM